jgi:predicted dehydrogenase
MRSLRSPSDDPEGSSSSSFEFEFEFQSEAHSHSILVLVEKPLCPTASQAQELVDLAKRQGVTLSVYQNRRWDSDFLTVKKLLKEGTVSTAMAAHTSWGLSLDPHRLVAC